MDSPAVFEAALHGEIDMDRADELHAIVNRFRISDCPSARVDLSAVTFLDSTGLGLLSSLRNTALERDGSVTLTATPPAVVKLLRLVGFDTIFTLEP